MAKQGTATGTVYTSPAKAKRLAQVRRREEAAWRALNGPVEVRQVDPAKRKTA